MRSYNDLFYLIITSILEKNEFASMSDVNSKAGLYSEDISCSTDGSNFNEFWEST